MVRLMATEGTLGPIPFNGFEVFAGHDLRLHGAHLELHAGILLVLRLLDVVAGECIAHLLTYLLEKRFSLFLLIRCLSCILNGRGDFWIAHGRFLQVYFIALDPTT